MADRKLVYIGFTFSHHRNTMAGYQQIREYVCYDYTINCDRFIDKCNETNISFFCRGWRYIVRRLTSFPVFPTHILKCILLGLIHNNLTFHFIYAENTYINIKKFLRSGNRIVCTVHQPYEWFNNPTWKSRLKSIDLLILLSETEIQKFASILGDTSRIRFIPHGIDTNYYKPASVSKKKMILTVGSWLRNWEFADKVYKELLEYDKDITVTIVSSYQNKEFITSNNRIVFLTNISNEELLQLYHECTMLFLPLNRFTANNSLLEAAACGCRLLITTNHNDKSYIPPKLITILKMDVKLVSKWIISNLCPESDNNLVDYIRLNYSWEVIANKTHEVLIK